MSSEAERRPAWDEAARPMTWAWRIAFATACFDALFMSVYGFSVPVKTAGLSLGCAGAIYAVAWFYRRVRPDEALSALAEAASFLILFSALLAIASYLVNAPALRLRDAEFAAVDRLFGFDWREHLNFVASRPWLSSALERVYETSIPQIAAAALGLALTRNLERLKLLALLFAITGIITVAVSGLLPAAGAYAYFQPDEVVIHAMANPQVGHWHLEHLYGLRDGTLRLIPLPFVEGLITFPSFHAALAVITAWALLGLRFASGPGILLNIAVIYSALTMGGHYLADIIGGGVIALCSIALVTGRRASAPLPRMAAPLAA